MSDSSFVISVGVPRQVSLNGRNLDRDAFFEWAWQSLAQFGLQGVHEGSVLSEQAADLGIEETSWTVDSGEAPRGRDWVASQRHLHSEFYFGDREGASAALKVLRELPGLELGEIEERAHEDWDAAWKESFKGARVEPFWSIRPYWLTQTDQAASGQGSDGPRAGDLVLRINPGAGFGTGTHETTQLCLRALAEIGGKNGLSGQRVLDFGSGSGILAIGAALLGARADAVEIDELAIQNAIENAEFNQAESKIEFFQELPAMAQPYPVVVANILRPVLLEFAGELTRRLSEDGTLILSGLIDGDVATVQARYSTLLGYSGQVRELGEWRAIVWKKDQCVDSRNE